MRMKALMVICLSACTGQASAEGCGQGPDATRDEGEASSPDILFCCIATNGKEIRLSRSGASIDYVYGRPGVHPEIHVSKPHNEVESVQWDGIGRWMTYSVTLPVSAATYTLFTQVDRLSQTQEVEAGVLAIVRGKEVARILCREPPLSKLAELSTGAGG
ncbi:MAG TPA: hypothetical protein VGC74_16090 [Stenotrophomonas sp.]|jgi:hypothetical protein